MIRLIAILFLSLQLITSTELCQLVKLPVLIQHYQEHQVMNEGVHISFYDFLKLHYFNGDPKDGDYTRDMELPFKTNAGTLIVNLSHSITVPSAGIVLIHPAKEVASHFNKFYCTTVPSENPKDIFQPPRFF